MSEKLHVHENGACWASADKALMENPCPLLAPFAATAGTAGMGGQETEGKTTLRARDQELIWGQDPSQPHCAALQSGPKSQVTRG